ncbi:MULTISPECIES: magnesium-translocating P-type ATPase [Pseudonocardia]|uniref:Magnesium-transporting ATPase, P-type 1 n=2 Tax=Pseudonocardia TaxID=1847 RepID=A0A1Y2MI56_PSEAH|nr:MULTISPECIES: magnesium-translocating P-type ATPase [Pseudonocardia]OSY34954.1 Magnesium-transporting ATPase, P-type 1 [Pseudonocardia autotrophica]TDN72548.1 Mg2+-importing ATPase [Pseudonocardia autotrophica]BBG03256.1 magnesium-translocating P-type ATPase [Pseudonocardia autotrophica]GEC24514.1 magnesium-translocating P-type ATPase [Pseudonocardia saturnea]
MDRTGRRIPGGSPTTRPAPPGPPVARGETALRDAATADAFALLRGLDTSRRGLTEETAAVRSAEYGENVPAAERGRSAAGWVRRAVASPFAGLMVVLGALLAVADGPASAALVLLLAALGIGLRMWNEIRTGRAARVLRARVGTTVTVRRRPAPGSAPRESEIPPEDLVPGDVVLLHAGDPVPADLRLLRADDLLVDQSSLSGELLPVPKAPPSDRTGPGPRRARHRRGEDRRPVTGLGSLLLAGSTVTRGGATAVVLATGATTHAEQLAGRARRPRPESAVDRGVRSVSWTLVRCMLVAAPLVLMINGTVSGDSRQALLFAVAVTVGLAPELLSVIVGTTLLRGTARLRDAGVLVTRPDGIHDLGAIDVACLDKTGTLTEDRVVFTHSVDLDGRPDPAPGDAAAVAVRFQGVPRDGTDEALAGAGRDDSTLLAGGLLTRVGELPFDHARRRATVVLRDAHAAGELVLVRGDPDTVLPRCTHTVRDGARVELTRSLRAAAADAADGHRARGMRVVAVATRRAPAHDPEPERDLLLLGFVGMVDPVRASAATAVARFRAQGVAVKVLTGDDTTVAEQVCERAGIDVDGVLDGPALDAMNDVALARAVDRTTVFARLGPLQKERVVTALQAGGHTVGFLGDGVNDVAALRAADVGIGVDGAVPAARAAADIVLTDRGPDVVVTAVEEGRRTLGRATRYLTVTAALNVGNALSVVAASAVLPFLPLLPSQLVLQSVLFSVAALALPFDRVEPGWTARPRSWDTRGMLRFMAVFGPLCSAFDLLTFWAVWRYLGLDTPEEQAVFQAVWFVEGVLSQVLVLLLLRTRAGRPARAVVVTVAAVVVTGVALPFTPVAPLFGMAAPPAAVWPLLLAVVPPFLLCAAATRSLYLRHVLGIRPADKE